MIDLYLRRTAAPYNLINFPMTPYINKYVDWSDGLP